MLIPKIRNISIILVCVFALIQCVKDNNYLPYAKVDVDISLYPGLSGIGASCSLIMLPTTDSYRGLNGLILYRESTDVFKAYEMTCPYDTVLLTINNVKPYYLATDCKMTCTDSVVCPTCHSVYYLSLGGAKTKGPSRRNLKEYNVYSDGNWLHISN